MVVFWAAASPAGFSSALVSPAADAAGCSVVLPFPQATSREHSMTNARSKLIAFFIFSFLQSYFMVPVFIFTAQAVIPCIAGGRALPPERGAGAEHG